MAEDSWMYGCGVGDARAISAEDWHLFNDVLLCANRALQGVIDITTYPGYTGLLAATNPAGNTVRIASGLALVVGILYKNSANVDFDVTGPGGGAQTDLIVLRYTVLNNEVRLAHKQGVPGGAAATVQQDAAIWEIPIVTVFKAAGANLTSITDSRVYLHHTGRIATGNVDDLAITTVKVADSAITPIKIANRTRTFFIPAVRVYNATDLTYNDRFDTGVVMDDNKSCWAFCGFVVPKDFVSGLTVKAVIIPNGTGNVYNSALAYYGGVGQSYSTHSANLANTAEAVTAGIYAEVGALSLASANIDDYVTMRYIRVATDPLDTVGDYVQINGWIVTYTADS